MPMYNKVEICGVNTATLKVLSEAEKIRLLKQMHEGDRRAREELVQGNLRLVLSVVQRFAGRGENPIRRCAEAGGKRGWGIRN